MGVSWFRKLPQAKVALPSHPIRQTPSPLENSGSFHSAFHSQASPQERQTTKLSSLLQDQRGLTKLTLQQSLWTMSSTASPAEGAGYPCPMAPLLRPRPVPPCKKGWSSLRWRENHLVPK